MAIKAIFKQAHANPDKLAFTDRGNRISYGAFAYWIDRAREFVLQQNLQPGSIAALVDVTNRLDGWALNIALRSIGVTTISARAPETLQEIGLRNVGCVITTVQDRPIPLTSPNPDCRLVQIPNPMFPGQTAGSVPDLPALTRAPGAHILLTSGTTGTSKKFLVAHACLKIRMPRYADALSIEENSFVNVFGFALWTGIGFNVPLSTWNKGGSIVFHQGFEPHQALFIDGVTHGLFTPSTLAELLNAPADQLRRNETMRLFVSGGPLTRSLAEGAATSITSQICAYIGSTEVGAWTMTRIERPEDLRAHRILPDSDVQVVDEADRPLPAGKIGAIRIRAIGGAMRYLDDEKATQTFFRNGYFYPGDLGAFEGDGQLVLHGRGSDVINFFGYKIGVQQIEQSLQDRLGAEGVCILMHNDGTGEELVAVVQSRRPIRSEDLESALGAELPQPFRTRVLFMDALPRNDMGKIDRPRLVRQISAMRAQVAV